MKDIGRAVAQELAITNGCVRKIIPLSRYNGVVVEVETETGIEYIYRHVSAELWGKLRG